MSINLAVSQLLEVESKRQLGVLTPDSTLAIAMSRVGAHIDGEQRIVCGTLGQLVAQDQEVYGQPLHCLVIVGKRLHHLEAHFAEEFALDKEVWRNITRDVYGCALD